MTEPYAFTPDDSPLLAKLRNVLHQRANTRSPYLPPLPNASLVTSHVIPTLDMSAPSLERPIQEFLAALEEPYRSRVRPAPLFASSVSLDQAEDCLGSWLVGGLAYDVAIFDDDPNAGWDFIAELLVSLDTPPSTRFYTADHVFETSEEQRALFIVSAERLTMILVFGTD